MKTIIVKIIERYQQYLSPDHSFWAKDNLPYCKHLPTCSQYMIESIEKKWIIVWWLKGIQRIARCMPWSKPKYDPVKK